MTFVIIRIIFLIFAPCFTNLITFMEKFKPFNYVEFDFKQLCEKYHLSDCVCNDFVLTALGYEEFGVSFVQDLLFTIRVWNNMALFADKHIVFKFGLSGVAGPDCIRSYLRIWYEVDRIVSFSKDCKI